MNMKIEMIALDFGMTGSASRNKERIGHAYGRRYPELGHLEKLEYPSKAQKVYLHSMQQF